MFNKDIGNSIILTNSYNKNYLIKLISNMNKLINVRVMDTNEFINNYYFKYDKETIYYLMSKYNLKYDIALMYIKNMYYINDDSNNPKIDIVYNYKKELLKNNLLYINPNFKDYINSKKIFLYNLINIDPLIKNILSSYEEIKNSNDYKHNIYEFNFIDDEVIWCANKIIELVNNGVDINKIYLTNLNDEYRLIIKRIFNIYNIPFNINDNNSLYSTVICKKFIEYYNSDINVTLELLEKDIKDNDIDIYNKIVSICNKYVWIDDYLNVKELIINDLKNTNINKMLKENAVNEDSIYRMYDDDCFVFLFGFNQTIMPIIYKDEDYLSDKEKNLLGLNTSIINNINIKEETVFNIKNIKNLFITYKLKSLTDSFSISSINEILNYEVIKNNKVNYIYSDLYNKLELAKMLDLFNKYGIVSNDLYNLKNKYKNINYRLYDNSFKGISLESLNKFLDNKLLLSYSSLDNYNRCAFRYYINNILKISNYEETFMQFIGNLFHYVLSCAFTDNFDYDKCFDGYITKELSAKELFFIKKLKEELKFIIDTINEHNSYSTLNKELYEEKIYVNLEGNIKVTFMGIIDKLKFNEEKNIVAIIDYKTGNPNLNLNNVIYGIEMQLPIYIYLAKNHPDFKDINISGFYLQKILNNEIVAEKNISYDDLKRKNLLLQGYSNDNIDILEKFDSTYADSKVVKSLKKGNNGFYAYSKTLDNYTIDALADYTHKKIEEASNNILNAKFAINPKKIGDKNLGCEFCSFKDICYMNEKNIVNLKEYKDLSFLGGDDNGMD